MKNLDMRLQNLEIKTKYHINDLYDISNEELITGLNDLLDIARGSNNKDKILEYENDIQYLHSLGK